MTITSKWQTYRTTGYTHQIAGSDPRSTGGVHHHQVRRGANGVVLYRIAQCNGRYTDVSRATPATAEQVKAAEAAK